MEDLLASLFSAAVLLSGLPAGGSPPPVAGLPYRRMLEELCAPLREGARSARAARVRCVRDHSMRPQICDQEFPPADPHARCMGQRGLVAAYVIGDGRIVYRDDLDLRHDADNSFIVHEFVHALQDRASGGHAFDSCSATLEAERQAYRVQRDYLRARGQMMRVGERLREVHCEDLL